MKFVIIETICCLLFASLSACENKRPAPIPLTSNLVGKWQWTKTVTPTHVITPETEGYVEDLNFSNDAITGDNLAYYRNDKLILRLSLDRNGTIQEDRNENTLLLPFGDKYIKFFLKKNKDNAFEELETSQPTSRYNVESDTVRSYYKYVDVPRK